MAENANDACMGCPLGLECDGSSTVWPVVASSTWIEDGAIYRLQSCPLGYYVSPNNPVDTSNAVLQKCSLCGKG